eukprot:5653963-Heterocapsa_arctica.AAC.1
MAELPKFMEIDHSGQNDSPEIHFRETQPVRPSCAWKHLFDSKLGHAQSPLKMSGDQPRHISSGSHPCLKCASKLLCFLANDY